MTLQYLILGLLQYGSQTGYDLNKVFRKSVEHFWNTEQSQIYRALYKMHEAGWVRIEQVEQENLPAKKIYHLTEKGREELQSWLATPQSLSPAHEAWLGQLFFGFSADKEQLRRILEQRIQGLQKQLAYYEQDIPAYVEDFVADYNAPSDLPYWLLTWDYGVQKLRFDLQWAQHALASLAQLPDKESSS